MGGGTQSTVLALLADQGHFDHKPDMAIFADTGWEPPSVYKNVEWLKSVLSFPVITVMERSLREDVIAGVNTSGKPWVTIPVFMTTPEGEQAGINWRQCTNNYKIKPIRDEVRRQLGLAPRSPVPARTSVEMWLGITVDESERVKTNPDIWVRNTYPLIDLEMSRDDCISWFHNKYPNRNLPRSACIGCPFHSPKGWIEMKNQDKDSFEEAVEIDAMLRSPKHNAYSIFRNNVFLHSRRLPLDEAVALDSGELKVTEEGHWGNECAGICGT